MSVLIAIYNFLIGTGQSALIAMPPVLKTLILITLVVSIICSLVRRAYKLVKVFIVVALCYFLLQFLHII